MKSTPAKRKPPGPGKRQTAPVRWPGWGPVHGPAGFEWAVRFRNPTDVEDDEVEFAKWRDLGLPSPLEKFPPKPKLKRKRNRRDDE